MRDPAPELYRELEMIGHFVYPPGERRQHRCLIEGTVDLDAVEQGSVVSKTRTLTESFRECLFIWNRQDQAACPAPKPGEDFCVHTRKNKQRFGQPIMTIVAGNDCVNKPLRRFLYVEIPYYH
jgi:hypothetical protein